MTKRLLAIYLILVVLLAAIVPSCTSTGGTGTINVNATLCDVSWNGSVNYTLTPGSGSPVNGNNVSASFSVATGNWTCAYVSGGPAGAFLVNITPSGPQSVSANTPVTFTLVFELNQDAGIQWLWWTRNETPVPPQGNDTYIGDAVPCNIIDAHFAQWVAGCEGYNATIDETSYLAIMAQQNPDAVQIYVVNDWNAVNKTPAPLQKVFQNTTQSIMGQDEFVNPGDAPIPLPPMTSVTLDVETQWQLVKGTNYTKAINWLGISKSMEGEVPEPHPGVLFELVLPPGPVHQYTFILQTAASVALVSGNDTNSTNDMATSNYLYLTVWG
jgi:hypothetical protein